MENIMEKIKWVGKSGRAYMYNVYEISVKFRKIPANYIIACGTGVNKWKPIYIGETADLSERLDTHHKISCIRENRATHIHVHRNEAGEQARLAEEADLISRWHPVCNN
jgi:hypothetical protein